MHFIVGFKPLLNPAFAGGTLSHNSHDFKDFLTIKQKKMTSYFEDLDTIVQRLAVLNAKFTEYITGGKQFEKTKKIFLEIKQTHGSLRAYFPSVNNAAPQKAEHPEELMADNPINYMIQKWDEGELPDHMKDFVASKIPVLRLVYGAHIQTANA